MGQAKNRKAQDPNYGKPADREFNDLDNILEKENFEELPVGGMVFYKPDTTEKTLNGGWCNFVYYRGLSEVPTAAMSSKRCGMYLFVKQVCNSSMKEFFVEFKNINTQSVLQVAVVADRKPELDEMRKILENLLLGVMVACEFDTLNELTDQFIHTPVRMDIVPADKSLFQKVGWVMYNPL